MDPIGKKQHRHHASPAMGGAERWVTTLACGWVVALPWLIAGWLWWVQALGVGLGALALAVALSVRENRRVLWRFSVFWLGLAFVVYVTCQACNPWLKATPVAPGANIWTLSFPVHVAWLPAGMEADFVVTNTWRELVYWTGPWLLGCAWWVAARRRHGVYWLWGATLVNSVLISGLSVGFYFHRSFKILWLWWPDDAPAGIPTWMLASPAQYAPLYMGGFISRDAAAMYLYMSLAAGLALALHTQRIAQKTGRDTGLLWVVLTGCAVNFGGLILSGSRAGVLVGAAILGVGALLLVGGMFRGRNWSAGQVLAGAIFMAGFLGVGVTFFTVVKPLSLIRLKEEMPALDQDGRFELIRTTQAMISDREWLGFGGGSYRYVAPYYFRKLGIFTDPTHYDGLAYAVYHAHSDPLQLAMEYGALGAGILLLILLYWAARACWLAGWLGLKGWMALLGPGVLLMHSCLDYPFFNLAVLTLFTLLVVSAVKLAELNRVQGEGA